MRLNTLMEKLRANQIAIGLGSMYAASGIIEGMCKGWDFVWIDAQHGQYSYDSTLHAVQAADAVGIDTVLRVPGHESGIIGPMADLCPSAVMVPMVDTPAQAQTVVDALRFPPLGKRSFGGRRVVDLDGRNYFRERELGVIAQTETLEAVENAQAIIDTEGIDMLFFGPDDMKIRMNIPISTSMTEHPQLRKAMERTAAAAQKAGKLAGTVTGSVEAVHMAVKMGYQLLVCGCDIVFLRTGAAQKLDEMRNALTGNNTQPATSDTVTGLAPSSNE